MLVAFASSMALVFQAAQAFDATPAQITSWIWALGLGMGLCTLLPSLWLRKPVMIAWSTPGAAVLATAGLAGDGFSMAQAVGAFMLAALLAGVLARFGMQAFAAAQTALPLVLGMLLTYLVTRRVAPRYCVVWTLVAGICLAWVGGEMSWPSVNWMPVRPVFTAPEWSWPAAVSLALPLFVVTMASQNLPGVAVIRASGYDLPISRLITMTGVVTLLLAPFGAFALNLSAITAAICMGPQAHADPGRRYAAAAVCGLLYLLIGVFGGVVTGLLTAFPRELVAAIAGLALLGAIGSGLSSAFAEEKHREAALITFLVTLSGVVIFGVGSALWGLLAGSLALFVQQYGRRRA